MIKQAALRWLLLCRALFAFVSYGITKCLDKIIHGHGLLCSINDVRVLSCLSFTIQNNKAELACKLLPTIFLLHVSFACIIVN